MLKARQQAEATDRRESAPSVRFRASSLRFSAERSPSLPHRDSRIETRAQDAALQARQAGKKQFQMPDEFQPQTSPTPAATSAAPS